MFQAILAKKEHIFQKLMSSLRTFLLHQENSPFVSTENITHHCSTSSALVYSSKHTLKWKYLYWHPPE